VGKPFDKLVPIGAVLVALLVLFKTSDLASPKMKIMTLIAGAFAGILTNYSAKLILGAKTAGGVS
jgi:hypothetical protein